MLAGQELLPLFVHFHLVQSVSDAVAGHNEAPAIVVPPSSFGHWREVGRRDDIFPSLFGAQAFCH